MKVEIGPRFGSDSEVERVATELRHCVECGAANSVCATYQVLNDELDSPRGRNRLIRDMLASGELPSAETVRHIDQCLSCNACAGLCLAQVDFRRVMDFAREKVEEAGIRSPGDRLFRWFLGMVLPNPGLFRAALTFGRIGALFKGVLPERLAALTRQARLASPSPRWIARPLPEAGRGTVAILDGCVNSVLGAHLNAATERVLNRLGYSVAHVPSGCCGALNFHMGQRERALGHARGLLAAWREAEAAGPGFQAVIVNASGCGSMLKDWGHLFEGEPEQEQAARYAALARDVTEFIDPGELASLSGEQKSGLVAFHPPCSLQHVQRILSRPEALLRACGFDLVPFREKDLCCGSAGAYSMLNPELSVRVRDRKAAAIEDSGAEMIASANIGCMTHIGQGTRLPILHVIELVDWATGGPRPTALQGGAGQDV